MNLRLFYTISEEGTPAGLPILLVLLLHSARSGHNWRVWRRRGRAFHSSADNLSFLPMKTQGTDATPLNQYLQKFHYKFNVVHVHYLHDLLHFVVSDHGPLDPFPCSLGSMVPLFLSIRTGLYSCYIKPSNLARTVLQLNYTAEKPLPDVLRKFAPWVQVPATLLHTRQTKISLSAYIYSISSEQKKTGTELEEKRIMYVFK